MRSSLRAFTLIELLVVIAIIGILSAVVLASLDTARAKGADAAVKSNLEQARAQAELFYDANNSSYLPGAKGLTTDVCSSTGLATGNIRGIYQSVLAAAQAISPINTVTETAAVSSSVAACNPAATAWAAESVLKTTAAGGAAQYFCVDSTGAATSTTTLLPAAQTHC